jgi:hypothetical protein
VPEEVFPESVQEGAPSARERRLYFLLALIASVNLLAICGAATFFFLVEHF